MDNAIVGFKCMHKLRRQRTGRLGYFCLKLDMSKVYDRVEWDFMEAMITRLGFSDGWVKKVSNCIRSLSFSVLVNGMKGTMFSASKGLRQGCPLSPFFLIICVEGLSMLIQNAMETGSIKGIQVARRAPQVSYLFFIDDSLLFAQAK